METENISATLLRESTLVVTTSSMDSRLTFSTSDREKLVAGVSKRLVNVQVVLLPSIFKLEVDDSDATKDVSIHDKLRFTSVAKKTEPSAIETNLFTGVVIKNIPEALPRKHIEELFKNAGVDEVGPNTTIQTHNGKTTVEVINLGSDICCKVIENLNETKVSENKIYCRGLSDLSSPVKPNPELAQVNVNVNHTPQVENFNVNHPAQDRKDNVNHPLQAQDSLTISPVSEVNKNEAENPAIETPDRKEPKTDSILEKENESKEADNSEPPTPKQNT